MGGLAETAGVGRGHRALAARREPRRAGDRRGPALDALSRDRGAGDPDDRPPPAGGRRTCARPWPRSVSPATWSASATSPRTSPSGSLVIDDESGRSRLAVGVEHIGELALRAAEGRARRLRQRDDPQRAPRCWQRDKEIDALYTSLFRELLTYMMEDPRNITLLHAPPVLRQEPRADRRPRHQHRRDRALRDHRRALTERAPEERRLRASRQAGATA